MVKSPSVFTGLWVAILPSHLPSCSTSTFRVFPLGGMLIFGGTSRVWPQICRGYL
ncbi:hypothetical protein BD779DRAFT_1579248 [Infundibulicybe gibba]|nr:hypothetical protein BD779DRAFT_1579248 [Infundibulicybe gibba]